MFKLSFSLAFVTQHFGARAGSCLLGSKTSALSAMLCLNDMFGVTPLEQSGSHYFTVNELWIMFFSVCLCIVDFCFVFKLLLQTRSIELPTYRAPISFPLDYARSLWSAISLGWCKSGGVPRVQPWLRGPHTQRHTGVFYHASWWESNLVGHPTCAAATFATSIKTHARNMLPLFTQMF